MRRNPSFRALIAAAGLLSIVGCWEEIHYTPKSDAADEPAAAEPSPPSDQAASARENETTVEVEAPANEPPEQVPPVLPPSGEDLFAPATPPEASEQVATSNEGDTSAPPSDSILPTPSDGSEATAPTEDPQLTSTEPATASPPTPAERRLAWQAMSKWALAAAIYAKGLPRAPQAPILEDASAAAGELGLELPELPTTTRPADLEGAVIEGLRGELAVALRNTFANRFGETEGAAADLAVRSHLLLLTYSPREADASLQAEGLRRAGEASGLPPALWTPLAALVEERGSFLDVRQAVFDLQRRVEARLAEAADEN